MTITLYKYIQSELIKKGLNEIVDSQGNLVFFNEEAQFMTKMFSYDQDVSDIVDRLFTGVSLDLRENDLHFKKAFLYRFVNRQINRQTIEAFRLELLSTFLSNKDYINRIYSDLENYLTQSKTGVQNNTQTDNQTSNGNTTSDNRDAEATLPQNNIQIDVDSTVMTSANSNRISRNKQQNNQTTDSKSIGETSSEYKDFKLDELFKTNGLYEQIYTIFDKKCFMQIW